MAEICQKGLDCFGMPAEWALSIVVPITKGNGDIRNCSCNRAVKLLQHGMKVVERVFEKRLCRLYCLLMKRNLALCLRGTIYAAYILRRMQEEYHVKGKKVVYVFCGPRESF